MNSVTCAILAVYCISVAKAIVNQEEKSRFIKGLFFLVSICFACIAVACMFLG